MARLDYPDCSPLPPSGAESASAAPSQTTDAPSSLHDRATGRVPDQVADRVRDRVPDRVPWDCPGVREIAFTIPERYNASTAPAMFDK